MPPTYKRKNQGNQRLAAVADPDSGMPKLTPKQEKFALAILDGNRATEAYRLAFGVTSSNRASIAASASHLLSNPKIQQAIRCFQRIGLDRAAVDRESHLAELARGRELAYELGQASAGIQAEHYRGRVAGLYNDKLTIGIGPSDSMLLAQLGALLGPETAKLVGEALGHETAATGEPGAPSEDAALLALPPPGEPDFP